MSRCSALFHTPISDDPFYVSESKETYMSTGASLRTYIPEYHEAGMVV